jgi:hypothetical protein
MLAEEFSVANQQKVEKIDEKIRALIKHQLATLLLTYISSIGHHRLVIGKQR